MEQSNTASVLDASLLKDEKDETNEGGEVIFLVPKLREKYEQAVKQSKLPPKDQEVCLLWLQNDPASHTIKELTIRLNHLEEAEQRTENQRQEYAEQIRREIQQGLFSEQSKENYIKWFMENLSYEERRRYLQEKNTNLHDPKRKKTFAEFEELLIFFKNAPQSSRAEVKKTFLNSDLQKRQKAVEELKKKKQLAVTKGLPRVVREALTKVFLSADFLTCQQLFEKALTRHRALKARFLRLPPLVQEESKKTFKAIGFNEREAFLDFIERKMGNYAARYRKKIQAMQETDEDGLSLFSIEPATKTESSASLYMEWFSKKLGLKGMEAALEHSDLDNDARKWVHHEMAQIIKKFPENERSILVMEFNKSELTQRKKLVAQYRKKAEKRTTSQQSQNFVERWLRRLFLSGENNAATETMETKAVCDEIAQRRHRARLNENTTKESSKLQETVHAEALRESDGSIKIKSDVLENKLDARRNMMSALRPDLNDPNAKLAADVRLRTRSGEVVEDEEAYKKGELEEQRRRVRDAVIPFLLQRANVEGVPMRTDQIKDALQATDLERLGKEIIRKAA